MTDGNSIADWIKVARIAEEYNKTPFFGVAIQAPIDNGNFFCVVFDTGSQQPIKGGLEATPKQLQTLRGAGVEVKEE